MNPLTINQLFELCKTAIDAGKGDSPVHISVNWGTQPATDHTEIEDIDNENCCLVIRDEMKI